MPAEPIRVAQLVGNARSGGVSALVYNYYSHIDRTKVQFDFFTYGPSDYDERIRAMGGNVFYTANFINFPRAMRDFARHLDTQRYDIVHSHLTSLSVFPLQVARSKGVPIRICHAHSTTDSHERTAIVKNTLRHFAAGCATDLFACGTKSAEWLYGKKQLPNVFFVHNAVDTDLFSFDECIREEVRTELKIHGKCLGNIGRAVYQKNQLFLLDVFCRYRAFEPDCTLVIVADGALVPNILAKARALGIEDDLRLLPERSDVYRVYNAFDYFLLPSHYEGLPIVGIEAQANGLPCFFSSTITAETNVSGRCRYLDVDDADLWAAEIADTSADRYNASVQIKEAGYDIASAAQKLCDKYLSLVSATRSLR